MLRSARPDCRSAAKKSIFGIGQLKIAAIESRTLIAIGEHTAESGLTFSLSRSLL